MSARVAFCPGFYLFVGRPFVRIKNDVRDVSNKRHKCKKSSVSFVFFFTFNKVIPEMGKTTGAINLGIHLEGPFISVEKVGAHAKGHLRSLKNVSISKPLIQVHRHFER